MSNGINQLTAAERRMIYNYYRDGNTMKISPKQIAELTNGLTPQEVESICNGISKDKNDYQISDGEWTSWNDDGADKAKQKTGYENNGWQSFCQSSRTYIDDGVNWISKGENATELASSLYTGYTTIAANNAAKAAGSMTNGNGAIGKGAELIGKEASDKLAGAMDKIGAIGFAIATGLQLAQGINAEANPANAEQAKALNDMKEPLKEAQADSAEAADYTTQMREESEENANYVTDTADQTNSDMEEGLSEYELLQREIEIYDKMKTAGHEFTADEAKKYDEIIAKMETMKTDNDQKTKDASDEITSIYDDVEAQQGEFDGAAETMANTEGAANYVAEFDEKTVELTQKEQATLTAAAGSAGMNIAKGVMKAASSIATPLIAAIYAGGAAAAGAAMVLDGHAATKQADFNKDATEATAIRQETQGINNAAIDTHAENAEMYEAAKDNIAATQIVTPELTVPEGETPVVGNQNNALPEDDEDGNEDDKKNPKKPDVNGRT